MYAFTYKVVYDTNKTINIQLRGDTAEDAEDKIDALFPEGTTVNSMTLLMCQELADESSDDQQSDDQEPSDDQQNDDQEPADNTPADNPGEDTNNG